MKNLHQYPIVCNGRVSPAYYRLVVKAPALARAARPGMFVQAQVADTYHPLLRRPFSVHQADRRTGRVTLLYQVVGKGTSLLAQRCPGEYLSILGPLGRGFTLVRSSRTALLVAGGMGIAPLAFLANRLEQQGQSVILLFGQKQRNRALERQALPRLTRPASRVRLASEQQRQGCFQGLVTQLAARLLADGKGLPGTIPVYACGPWAFFRSLQETLRRYRHPCQVSLEGSLACGFGACLGCAVKRAVKPGYLKICSDGPVFDINEIDFNVRD